MKRLLAAILCACALAPFTYSHPKIRKNSNPTAQEQKQEQTDAQSYDAYVGEYQVQPGFVLTVTNENGKLMGKPTGDEKVEFKYEGIADQFYSKAADAHLKFVRDEQGAVTGVIVTLDGKDFPSKRIK